MKNSLKVFRADARRLSTNVVAVVMIMGLSILPSLYAWFNILSNWDPYGESATSNLKVAVFSEDDGTSLEDIQLNVGDSVKEALQKNTTIGWVFPKSEDKAIDGVYSGKYYAALILTKDFSTDMLSFLQGEIVHPEIKYYENEKKNAIAPKITTKARGAVQEQVNEAFVGTLAKTITQIANSVSGLEGEKGSFVTIAMDRLNDLDQDVGNYMNILDSFINVTNSASSLIETTKVVIPDMNSVVANGQNTVLAMQGTIKAGESTADTTGKMVDYSLSLVSSNLDNIATVLSSQLSTMKSADSTAASSVADVQSLIPYIDALFQNAMTNFKDDATLSTTIATIETHFQTIQTDLASVNASVSDGTSTLESLETSLIAEIKACKSQVDKLANEFDQSVKPSLDSTLDTMDESMLSVQTILNGMDGDFSEVGKVLDDYSTTLAQGTDSLTKSRDQAQQLKDSLEDVITQLKELEDNAQYKSMMKILMSDPETLGEFISSPVRLETKEVYSIANYGSAMAPFYTILALWVGALILVAIIHVPVHPEPGLENVKPHEKYFGRYIVFFTTGQAQALIMVLGNLFFIGIQCHHPILFWLTASVSSLVFTFLLYSLTYAFGNVGEALAIILMVIQVAGAGGTFPVEVLPKIYQAIYRYLPFTSGINAMRETIGGMYGVDYLVWMGNLCVYLIVALIIGLGISIPFRKMNRIIEESKEKTGLML